MSNSYIGGNTDSTHNTREQQQMQSRILLKKHKIAEASEFLHSLGCRVRNPCNPLNIKLTTLWSLQLLTGVCDSGVDKTEKTIQLVRDLSHLLTTELEAKLHRDVDYRIQVLSNQVFSDISTVMTLKRNPDTSAARTQLEDLIRLQKPSQSAIDAAAALFDSTSSQNQAVDRAAGFNLQLALHQNRNTPSPSSDANQLTAAATAPPVQAPVQWPGQGPEQQRDVFRFRSSQYHERIPNTTVEPTNVASQIQRNSQRNVDTNSTRCMGTGTDMAMFFRAASLQQHQQNQHRQQQHLQQQQRLQHHLQQLSLEQLLQLLRNTPLPSQNQPRQGQQFTQQTQEDFGGAERIHHQQQQQRQFQAQTSLLNLLTQMNSSQLSNINMLEPPAHAPAASMGMINQLPLLQSERREPHQGQVDQDSQIQHDAFASGNHRAFSSIAAASASNSLSLSAPSALAASTNTALRVDETRRQKDAETGSISSQQQQLQDDQIDQTELDQLLAQRDPSESWEIRFEELKEYKRQFGDCAVPQRYSANHQLATWVRTQRRMYKLMKAGEKTCMTPGRLHKLNSIGFVWVAR